MLVGVVPWVDDTISHKLGMGFTLCRLGHTGGLALSHRKDSKRQGTAGRNGERV